jgi:ligand-binding sensor domain-containing protein/DNA-binding CsgD family transcriptional regulator
MKIRSLNLIALIIIFQSAHLSAQIKNAGISYVRNFTKAAYQYHPKNLTVIQDKHGIMYFANGDGLLEFDGGNWSLLPMPNKSAVISLYKDSKTGRLYVGAQGEFGYVEYDSIGKLRYQSLSKKLPASAGGFGDIWKMSVIDGNIIAVAGNMIMILNQNKSWTILEPKGTFHPAFEIRKKIYVYDEPYGLLELSDNKLKSCKNCEALGNKRVSMMTPIRGNKTLIGTLDGSLFISNGNQIVPWKTTANDFLIQHQIASGVVLSDSAHIAVGTLHNGMIILDENGNTLQHLNSSNGLQNSSILGMFCDNSGNLWLALENGIDFVELNSPFTYYNEQLNLPGAGYTSAVYQGKLYLGTSHGVYYKNWSAYENPLQKNHGFALVENSTGQTWNLNNKYGELLLGHNNGGFAIRNNKAVNITNNRGGWIFLRWEKHPEFILEGCYSSLSVLKQNAKKQWELRNEVQGFRESFRIMEEDDEGNIWLSHPHKGIFKLTIDESLKEFKRTDFYNSAHGLPSDFSVYVSKINGQLVFPTIDGIYRFNNKRQRFEAHPQFQKFFNGKAVSKILEDQHGNIWFVADRKPGILIKRNNDYIIADEQFSKLEGKLITNFEHINPIDDSNVLFGTEDGFVHYDPSKMIKTKLPFLTHIRKVEDSNTGRLISENTFSNETDSTTIKTSLPFDDNELRFTFSCTSYQDLTKNQYQYKLEGFDKNWSTWTDRSQKEYTNLPEGTYTFKVRAKNYNNEINKEAKFNFKIEPPIYRSRTAYFIYGILSLFALGGIVKLISQRKEKQFQEEKLKSAQKIIQLENDKLENEVNFKQRELASLALNITSKNETLEQIKAQLKTAVTNPEGDGRAALNQIIKLIDNTIKLDNNWKKFEFYFDQVHGNFLERLREKYPDLTTSQLKLCAYLRMNLSSKEIATLMNISVAGIEKSRYRLRKKFNIEHDLMLADFIQHI